MTVGNGDPLLPVDDSATCVCTAGGAQLSRLSELYGFARASAKSLGLIAMHKFVGT